ncbi:hypothetical protein [Nodularia spumigena]|nr:hypothetical protein [Nodularia spumigena]MDB9322593.1 hypothetical protein [Nodularia spumigena CS-591/07A]MDB9327600.1 hypothetical protein [Nodularia spumigena CS-590/02]MDB9401236.1 hypothetical protein [Microcystis aeruginosa CS-567/02-A1]MDB9335865.1 hypothetical protein [Nodularia spumigena CS-590/01]MDB9339705.1 hypothetical protein [Nodularia spumigena CS-589/07]
MYLDHALISVFLSSFAPTLRERFQRMRLCVRYKDVVHLAENRCNQSYR